MGSGRGWVWCGPAALFVAVMTSSVAHATPRDTDDEMRLPRLAPMVHLGIGTPYGTIGVALDLEPWEWLAIEAGMGSNFRGVQLAVMPRLRVPLGRSIRLAVGSGISGGPYAPIMLDLGLGHTSRSPKHWRTAFWHNVEFSVDVRAGSAFNLRTYLGFGQMLNPDGYRCGGEHCSWQHNTTIPYVGMALGRAFEL